MSTNGIPDHIVCNTLTQYAIHHYTPKLFERTFEAFISDPLYSNVEIQLSLLLSRSLINTYIHTYKKANPIELGPRNSVHAVVICLTKQFKCQV